MTRERDRELLVAFCEWLGKREGLYALAGEGWERIDAFLASRAPVPRPIEDLTPEQAAFYPYTYGCAACGFQCHVEAPITECPICQKPVNCLRQPQTPPVAEQRYWKVAPMSEMWHQFSGMWAAWSTTNGWAWTFISPISRPTRELAEKDGHASGLPEWKP